MINLTPKQLELVQTVAAQLPKEKLEVLAERIQAYLRFHARRVGRHGYSDDDIDLALRSATQGLLCSDSDYD